MQNNVLVVGRALDVSYFGFFGTGDNMQEFLKWEKTIFWLDS